jgi:hypothetical protein
VILYTKASLRVDDGSKQQYNIVVKEVMNTLFFEKISQFDREAEPVSVSIPFAEGVLTDGHHLTIRDDSMVLPAQKRVLAAWPDGSIKWLLVHLQPDLPGNQDKSLTFEVTSAAPLTPMASASRTTAATWVCS